MRPRGVVALALLLVLAGCSYGYAGSASTVAPEGPTPEATVTATAGSATTATPTATAEATTTPTPESYDSGGIEVRGGELPVNAGAVFERTEGVLGADVRWPAQVVVVNLSERSAGTGSAVEPPFFELFGLGVPAVNDSEVGVAAFVADPSTVYVNERLVADPRLEGVLAHEYVHVVQFRTGAIQGVRLATDATFDGRTTSRAVIEGAAVFGADAYWERYLGDGSRPREQSRALYEESTGAGRLAVAPYRFGYTHVAARADEPTALGVIYRDPPATTEQLLHPNVTESPTELPVRAGDGEWLGANSGQRFGELFLRVALRAGVNESAATRAAAGWGNDARLDFVEDGARGYAWVLRFDDAANASEFEGVAADWLAARADYDGEGDRWTAEEGSYRLVRVDDRTVVWLAGDETFVADASAGTENGTVRVTA